MPASASDAMFRFVEVVKQLEAPDAISAQLFSTARTFGLDSFGISGIPRRGESIRPYVLLNGWSDGWYERYSERGYVHVDPVVHRLLRTDVPFTWAESCTGLELTARQREIMGEASDFRMFDGFTVPIHSIGGIAAIVTFGAERLDLCDRDRGALHMISIYAHSRIRQIFLAQGGDGGGRPVVLTPREQDCLNWSAEGKTAWEIGCILSISRRTVEQYLNSAAAKLGAVNRAQMVAEGFRRGLVK